MYNAKTSKAAHVFPIAVRVESGALVELPEALAECASARKAGRAAREAR